MVICTSQITGLFRFRTVNGNFSLVLLLYELIHKYDWENRVDVDFVVLVETLYVDPNETVYLNSTFSFFF